MRALLCLVLLLAPTLTAAAPEPPFDQAALRRHIAYLADDALEGRMPGTEGGNKAALYIATQLQAAGLKPGAKGGRWYQSVDLVERTPVAASPHWVAKHRPIAIDPELSQFSARDGRIALHKTRVIFAGYGLDQPDAGFTDLKDVDVRGKVVLILSGRPETAPDAPGLEIRRQAIARAGAIAVIALSSARDPWEIIRAQLGRGRTVPTIHDDAPVEAALAYPGWIKLIAASGADPAALIAAAGQPGFHARALTLTLDLDATSTVRRYSSVNVIGRIPGSDRPDEALFYLAHWDHLGLCRPVGSPDRICNGAVDNASGIALLIEVARRLANGPRPHRSIYIVATTAEEMGLYGARALVADPPVPLDHIAAALNFDTVAIAPAGAPIGVIGRGHTPLDPLIDAAAKSQGRTVDDSEAANAFLNRQDGWELLKAGIPTVMIGGAFGDTARLAAFLAGDYHKPSDDLSHPIPLDGAAEDGALQVVLGQMLADPAVFPLRR